MDASSEFSTQVRYALGWRFGAQFARVALQLVVMVALARLLNVGDFGLIGQAMIIVGLVTVFSEIGMAPALIQKKQLDERQKQIAVTISILTGVLFTAMVWGIAPVLAFVFRSQDAVPILRGMSFVFLFAGLNTTAGALLERDLNYKSLFGVDFIAYLLGYGAVGVAVACKGGGAWSLVAAVIGQEVLRTILILSKTRIAPALWFTWNEARELFRYGAGMSATRLVLYTARNCDYLLVGRLLGNNALGLYTRSFQLMTLPIARLSAPLNTVLFSAYSRIQSENERLRPAFLQNVAAVTVIVWPILAGLAVVGHEVIVVMYGAKWEAAALPYQILCLGGLPLCLHNICESVARAKGSIRGRLWRHLVYLGLIIANVCAGSRWGLPGVACGVLISLSFQCLLMSEFALRLIEAKWSEYLKHLWPSVALSAGVAAMAGLMTQLFIRGGFSAPVVLMGSTVTTSAVYSLIVLNWRNMLLPGSLRSVANRIWSTVVRAPVVVPDLKSSSDGDIEAQRHAA